MLKGNYRHTFAFQKGLHWLRNRNFHSKTLSYRDVIIFDHKFHLEAWLARNQQLSLKHPSHQHILSCYAASEYHRPYNYNNIGEFSLNIAAGEWKVLDSQDRQADLKGALYHDILIWPDGLLIKNLTEKDVSVVYRYISNEKSILADENNLQSFKKELNATSVIGYLPKDKIQIVINVSKSYPLFRAKNLLKWFHDSVDGMNQSSVVIKAEGFQIENLQYILATELSEHRNATQVMILPFEDCFEGILSQQQVQKILENYRNRLL
jgi:hypothetical protein